jgi:16S rRNA (cytidine1402-2'-O)-methyltransferase
MAEPVGEFHSFHDHNGEERLAQWGEKLATHEVVYVSDAGMPAISDPGQLLVAYCQHHGIKYDILPGPSAVVTAYAASGMESGQFVFGTFLPHKGTERQTALHDLLAQAYDIILYESPHRLLKLLEELALHAPERQIFMAKELTKRYQRYYKDSAQILYEQFKSENIRGEWVVVIEGQKSDRPALYLEDVIALDIPPKPKAKLIARLTGKSVKECYEEMGKK